MGPARIVVLIKIPFKVLDKMDISVGILKHYPKDMPGIL